MVRLPVEITKKCSRKKLLKITCAFIFVYNIFLYSKKMIEKHLLPRARVPTLDSKQKKLQIVDS